MRYRGRWGLVREEPVLLRDRSEFGLFENDIDVDTAFTEFGFDLTDREGRGGRHRQIHRVERRMFVDCQCPGEFSFYSRILF